MLCCTCLAVLQHEDVRYIVSLGSLMMSKAFSHRPWEEEACGTLRSSQEEHYKALFGSHRCAIPWLHPLDFD